MSSLANLPYGEILDYWFEKLQNKPYRNRFLLTKAIEVLSFKNKSNNGVVRDKKINIESLLNLQSTCNLVPEKPITAIVIPAYIRNEFDVFCLKRLINTLQNQTVKPDHIIVVDDNSPIAYTIDSNIELLMLDKNHGPARARNMGMDIALSLNNDVILFTDVDCIPAINWVEEMVRAFHAKPSCNLVSGNTKSHNKTWLGLYHEINGTLNGRVFKKQNNLLYGPTCNLSISRRVAELLRFNEDFPNAAGEDIEFCFRALHSNFKIAFCEKAIINHDFGYGKNPYHNLKKFCRQFSRYGMGERVLLQKIPDYYSYFNQTNEISARKSA